MTSLKGRPNNVFSCSTSLKSEEDTKAKRKALVEAELKYAISALKKPNRTLAVKEFVEAAERRASQPKSRLSFPPRQAAGSADTSSQSSRRLAVPPGYK